MRCTADGGDGAGAHPPGGERLDAKIDRLLEKHGFDVGQVDREIDLATRGKSG